jgi:hypothetical protein
MATTGTPACVNCRANANPMPEVAPVTMVRGSAPYRVDEGAGSSFWAVACIMGAP